MTEGRKATYRVALSNLGCRVNRVELDVIALSLKEAGCELVGQRDADAIVINTCAVTGEAQAKTRKAVRHAANLPQGPLVVTTGCVASLFADELAGISDRVVVEAQKAKVPQRVLACLGAENACMAQGPDGALGTIAMPPVRTTPTGRTRPGVKVQDGCDNRCTFCIVWKARGHSRSVPYEQVLGEVLAAQERGAREVVLTGINLGNYRGEGSDGRGYELPGLLTRLLDDTGVERFRLSSIEPPDVTDELLDVMAQAGSRVAPFLHICLQSGCDRTLRQMGRVYDTALFERVVGHARGKVPLVSIGTDLIVGFPGESDEDFEQSYEFCRRMGFSRMHVFKYSKRPGTPAAARDDQVDAKVSAERSGRMLALADDMRRAEAARHVGHEELVVVQYPGRGVSGGLFDVLVDEAYALDDLVRVRVHRMEPDGTLDARSSSIIK
ncbi:MAG: MiaB/RimO family radical SAM methylthiotransferase [Atopobiaceae bacterium]|nr:MiaB/RimO family radical SAM methylthiotransferase [Atopobiaceae bacterium]